MTKKQQHFHHFSLLQSTEGFVVCVTNEKQIIFYLKPIKCYWLRLSASLFFNIEVGAYFLPTLYEKTVQWKTRRPALKHISTICSLFQFLLCNFYTEYSLQINVLKAEASAHFISETRSKAKKKEEGSIEVKRKLKEAAVQRKWQRHGASDAIHDPRPFWPIYTPSFRFFVFPLSLCLFVHVFLRWSLYGCTEVQRQWWTFVLVVWSSVGLTGL